MDKKISKNEWLIMETLWANSPVFLSEIMNAMKGSADWKHPTYMTYLKRLTTAGYVSYDTISGMRRYSPAVTREQCVERETLNMKEKFSDKSARLVLAGLIREIDLSDTDYEELKKLISDMQGD